MKSRFAVSVLCAGVLGVAPSLFAQEAAETPTEPDSALLDTIPVAPQSDAELAEEAPAPGSSSRLVEEIVVTAQKREENIRDVPIAITAYSADKLEALGIQSAQDLERITPGLTVTNAGGFNLVYLRGVGTDAFLPGADPSVPFYVDGVALLGGQGTSDTLGRVRRVEVLKGPQGTLFGRNATGGAVNIITPDPDDVFTGDASAEFGNYGATKLLGYVNVPILDGLAASLSGYNQEQDNFYVNDGIGGIPDVYSRGGRAKLRWQATEDFRITLAGSYQDTSGNGGLNFENTRVAPLLSLLVPEDPKADRRVNTDSFSGATFNSTLLSVTLDWALSGVDAKLIGSDQVLDSEFVQADFDKSFLPIVNIESLKQVNEQRTLELQFLSNEETPFSENFEWVAGLFYLDSSGGYDPIQFEIAPNALAAIGNELAGSAGAEALSILESRLSTLLLPLGVDLANGIRVLNAGLLVSTAYSAYVQGTFHLAETLDLTTGLRFQREERDLERSRLAIPNPNGGEIVIRRDSVPTLDTDQLSPRIALKWQPFSDDSQIYASWARAFKSPTYNTVNLLGGLPVTIGGVLEGELVAPEIRPVKEEKVETYELGIKTDFFDGNLNLNAAVFYTEQTDLLTGFVALLSGGVVTYDNAPGAEIKGAEADFLWVPMPDANPGLVVTGAVSFLDAKYTDYPNGKGFDETTGLAFGDGGTEPLPARDFKGNRIVRTPEYTYNIGLSQTFDIFSGSLELGADVNYNDGFFFLPQNSELYAREANTLVNARVTYFYTPWDLELGAFCNNLSDEEYNEIVFVDDFGRNQILNSPRTYGLRAKWAF
ncbi:MAG: TonB-dependent receptor [Panacagrimonas sp.]